MARITIGIPFYNCEDTLADAVRSVFAQTFEDWELILLDDGSTDDSLSIARSIEDSRVKVISDGVNKGIGARRRQLVEMTQTEYLAWQDADDMMHPERLEKQFQYLEANLSVGLLDNWSYLIDTKQNVVGISRLPELNLKMADVVKKPVILNGSSLGRTQLYRDNPFDLACRRAEDWEMCIRAFQDYDFGRILEPLYFRTSFQTQGTRTFELKAFKDLKFVRFVILKHGPRLIGWHQTLLALAEIYARIFIRAILSVLRLQKLRPQTKKIAISEAEKNAGLTVIKQIQSTQVPGLDNSPSK